MKQKLQTGWNFLTTKFRPNGLPDGLDRIFKCCCETPLHINYFFTDITKYNCFFNRYKRQYQSTFIMLARNGQYLYYDEETGFFESIGIPKDYVIDRYYLQLLYHQHNIRDNVLFSDIIAKIVRNRDINDPPGPEVLTKHVIIESTPLCEVPDDAEFDTYNTALSLNGIQPQNVPTTVAAVLDRTNGKLLQYWYDIKQYDGNVDPTRYRGVADGIASQFVPTPDGLFALCFHGETIATGVDLGDWQHSHFKAEQSYHLYNDFTTIPSDDSNYEFGCAGFVATKDEGLIYVSKFLEQARKPEMGIYERNIYFVNNIASQPSKAPPRAFFLKLHSDGSVSSNFPIELTRLHVKSTRYAYVRISKYYPADASLAFHLYNRNGWGYTEENLNAYFMVNESFTKIQEVSSTGKIHFKNSIFYFVDNYIHPEGYYVTKENFDNQSSLPGGSTDYTTSDFCQIKLDRGYFISEDGITPVFDSLPEIRNLVTGNIAQCTFDSGLRNNYSVLGEVIYGVFHVNKDNNVLTGLGNYLGGDPFVGENQCVMIWQKKFGWRRFLIKTGEFVQ